MRYRLTIAVALGIVLGACSDHASSVSNGTNPPGAGGSQRGGANAGNAAGDTGHTSDAGGKFNNGPTERSKSTEGKKQ